MRSFGKFLHHNGKIYQYMSKYGFAVPEKSSVLCVGCGNGDVMMEQLLPLLPETITRIVGTDDRSDLLNSAKNAYKSLSPRVTFMQMNLQDEAFEPTETFDHVVSLWDVRWMKNIRVSLENYLKLLKRRGTVFIVFVSKNAFTTAILNLASKSKWKHYLNELHDDMSPYQLGLNPKLGTELLRLRANRLEFKADEHHCLYHIFPEFEEFDQHRETELKFYSKIPKNLAREFYEDLIKELQASNMSFEVWRRRNIIDISVSISSVMFQK